MNPFPIDAYAYTNRLRWIHPGEKLLFAIATLVICVAAGTVIVAAMVTIACVGALVIWARIPASATWMFLRIPLGFSLVGAATLAMVIVPVGTAIDGPSVAAGPLQVGISDAGLAQATTVAAVSFGSVSATLFLALTTPMVEIVDQLRRWRVPTLFVDLMLLTYRFIFVLLESAGAMHTAQRTRHGYRTMRTSLRSAGILASMLFVRAAIRSSAVFAALCTRGYDGELRVVSHTRRWNLSSTVAFVGIDAALILVAALAPA